MTRRASQRPPLVPALLAAALLLGCAADPQAPTPAAGEDAVSATAAPSASPTPPPGLALTPVPGATGDLALARRREAEGDLRGAAEAYVAAAAAGGAFRSEAVLGAARLLLELERPADVRLLLEGFLADPAAPAAGRYLLARAYASLGMWPESLAQYDLYVGSGGPALPYAYYDRGNVLLELGRPSDAVASYRAGLAAGPTPASRRGFLLAIAQAYERASAPADAIAAYRALMEESDLAADAATALARIAAIKRELADATYTQDLARLFALYPATPQALRELDAAIARGESYDATSRGLVFYRNFDYGRAEAAFREQTAAAPEAAGSAAAYYYLGAILESRGQLEAARQSYARAAALDPAAGIADDALWWQARILEDAGDAAAGALYDRILAEYPASSWAPEAAFRRGMLPFRSGAYAEAAAVWQQGALALNPAERQRLLFWQGKALLMVGDEAAARAVLEPLGLSAEDDYYGIRARGLLAAGHGQPQAVRERNVDLAPAYDWAQAEAWLFLRTGLYPSSAAWRSDPRWARAQELWLVGRASQGDAEVFGLIEALARDPAAMYTLARALQEEGRFGMSARAGQRLLRVLDTNPNAGLPKALLSLSYPAAFGQSAGRHAAEAGISPLLLLAFVRQESFFDPRAVSPAGALGLTQVLPATGRSLAGRLGVADFDSELLLQADANLRFGARYMAEQLAAFDQELFVAFAAYNAGPGAARRWRAAPGAEDADLFLENVEFAETRTYIAIVAENYAIYRYLYGGEPHPDLPD